MDTNTRSTNGATQEAHGKNEGMTEAEFEVAKVDGIAYETHKKALSQRVKFKEEAANYKSELESYKQRELENQGKYKELVDSQRKRIDELETKDKDRDRSYQWNVIGAQIKSEFARKGVNNPEKALKFAAAAHKDDLNTIEVDDQYNVNSSDMQRFVDKFLNENIDMGFVNKVGISDLPPSGHARKEEGKKISKLSEDELMDAWKNSN